MATVNFYLKEPKSKDETCIFLAFTSGEKRFKFYTQKKIHPHLWDKENQRPKKSFVGSPELKAYLVNLEGTVERILTQFQTLGQPFTMEQIKRKLNEEFERRPSNSPQTLFQFIEDFIGSVKSLRATLTIRAYNNTLKHLKDFQSKYPQKKIDFDSITLDFYNDFIEYLMHEKLFSTNSIGKQIKNLKMFLNEATERGLNTKLDFKSKRFKVVKEDSDNIYLRDEEIETICKLDLSQNTRLERVRDLFVVGCHTGLRFSDFSQIKPENIKEKSITIRTKKTDEIIQVPIHDTVKAILKKYQNESLNSLPKAPSNQKMNQYLKEIGMLAGLKEKVLVTMSKGGKKVTTTYKKFELITTHSARRSFATNLYLQGYPSISLMKITGHKTEKAFLTYIKTSQEENANMLHDFWNKSKMKIA